MQFFNAGQIQVGMWFFQIRLSYELDFDSWYSDLRMLNFPKKFQDFILDQNFAF